jgi:hypothetical protein
MISFLILSLLDHLAKGNVSFCHHLASVVCCPLSSDFRGEDLKKSVNQKHELPVVAMFGNGSGGKYQSL